MGNRIRAVGRANHGPKRLRGHLMYKYTNILLATTFGLLLAGCGTASAVSSHSTNPERSVKSSLPAKSAALVKPATAPPLPAFQSGINVEVWGTPSTVDIDTVLQKVAQLHVRVVALVVPFGQSNWQSTNVGPVSFTPPPAVINRIIQQAYQDHLSVMLRPMLDEGTLTPSGHWRGDIVPTSAPAWFSSYTRALIPYAILAQQDHVGAFDVGTELTSLEDDGTLWKNTIGQLRDYFHGPMLYSFNWNSPSLAALPSWTDSLTWIGLDAYYPLSTSSGSVPALVKAWQPWVAQRAKIPNLVITEVGVMPKARAWETPWVWNPPGPTDWSVQARYYTATMTAWEGHSHGIYWWGVMMPRSGHGPSFDPIDHVSGKVMQNIFSHN